MKTSTQRCTALSPEPLELGTIVITPAANAALSAEEVLSAVSRHTYGDWGELDAEDWIANKRALVDSERILSAYCSGNGAKFYVITEWHRMFTTVLLSEDIIESVLFQ